MYILKMRENAGKYSMLGARLNWYKLQLKS